jgi:REP-associated tyrosine transposase|tara:strand:- start:5382 stop:6314 length:933 start_codon:yes stop_codon:yes gene_type:complete
MARPLRLEFAGALYHVTARGNRREMIYEDQGDRFVFLEKLSTVCLEANWLCHAYCLMSNHYHLLLETPEANLGRGMRQLNGCYSQYFNRKHGRCGHVFQGRYSAVLVEKQAYLLELARYIVLNPVRARMVHAAEEWPWSSYRGTVGRQALPEGVSPDWILAAFGESRATAIKGYKQFVSEGANQPSPWEELKNQVYLGSDAFVGQMVAKLDDTERLSEVPATQRHPVARSLEEFAQSSQDRNAAIRAAHASGGYSMREIADHFDLHYSRVSRIVRGARGKTSYLEDAEIKQDGNPDESAGPTETGKTLGN